jgi:hypothetical protein
MPCPRLRNAVGGYRYSPGHQTRLGAVHPAWPRPIGPASVARLTTAQISAAFKRARRRGIAQKAERIQVLLRATHLGQLAVVAAAYASWIRALVAVLATLNEQVKTCMGTWRPILADPDAPVTTSQPGRRTPEAVTATAAPRNRTHLRAATPRGQVCPPRAQDRRA